MIIFQKYVKSAVLLPSALILGALVVLWGCGNEDRLTEPLDEIIINEGAVLEGTVKDTNGRLAVDALVTLEPMVLGLPASLAPIRENGQEGGATNTQAKSGIFRVTLTDAEGFYQISGLDAGQYLLTANHQDHQGSSKYLDITLESAAQSETTVVDIALTPTGTLLGNAHLENASDHTGSFVFIPGTSHVAATDPAGDYSLSGVPVGTWNISASHVGYQGDSTSGTITAAGDSITLADMMLLLDSNLPPQITDIGVTPGLATEPTVFTGAAHDQDGTIALYEWDFEDDGIFDWSSPTEASTSFIYPDPGDYRAKLRVTDEDGDIALAVVDFTVLPLPVLDGIFVSIFGDDAAPGTIGQPLLTINAGILMADLLDKTAIYVSTGQFDEEVTLTDDGISLFGGFDTDWERVPGSRTDISWENMPLSAYDKAELDTISGFNFVSQDASIPGESSIAVGLFNSNLVFLDCGFYSGGGMAGLDGIHGDTSGGEMGNPGLPGACDEIVAADGGEGGMGAQANMNGGNGGAGGQGAMDGADGIAGAGFAGGAGGAGGGYGPEGVQGQPGFDGQPGGIGTHGSGGSAVTAMSGETSSGWEAAYSHDGIDGNPGFGGGGGGGGGGRIYFFDDDGTGNGGGGGGSGGQLGSGGAGGQGGGASFGLYLINSTATVADCIIQSGLGGQGGQGGWGSLGEPGGLGGLGGTVCIDYVGAGGNGGEGGYGGGGGGGGGGPGGPSYCIYYVNIEPVVTNSTLTPGTGGAGGNGGMGSAEPGGNGQDGPSGTIYP